MVLALHTWKENKPHNNTPDLKPPSLITVMIELYINDFELLLFT